MIVRLRHLAAYLAEAFWLLPALMVAGGIAAALLLIAVDRSGGVPRWLVDDGWLYDGGATGARTLLGAIVASTIGVAGTVFSITIAALAFAAGQMGPRLLHDFVRDRGNQFALGAFVGNFAYALLVLRSVRAAEEGTFIPHLALAVAIALALGCVATLVYFIGHMARRLNVVIVIEQVGTEMLDAFRRLSVAQREPDAPPEADWHGAAPVRDERQGYLQELDAAGLADWAHAHGATLRLLVRPGSFVFPGTPIALMHPAVEGAGAAILAATALGGARNSSSDIEFAARLLVEVALRALSPSLNDPFTAIGVLDRLGAGLCELAPRFLPTGVHVRDSRVVLVAPGVDYDGLVDSMLHQIRQSSYTQPAVLMRMLEVLTAVAACEADTARRRALRRHADLVLGDAERHVTTPSDLQEIRERHRCCGQALEAPSVNIRRAT